MAVNVKVQKVTGLDMDDLPDWLSWDSWHDGMSVDQGVQECLEQTGWYDMELVEDEA